MNKLANLKYKLLLKRTIFLVPIVIGILSLWLAIKPEPIKVESVISSMITATPSPSPSTLPTADPIVKNVPVTQKPSPQILPTFTPTTATPVPLISQATVKTDSKKLQVNISINNNAEFSVLLEPGSNQCDALSKALEQGKINSLNMKYDENYKTYAVYQINGIGKENDVWWVFEINGKSADKGCSFIKVNENDIIKWIYLGS